MDLGFFDFSENHDFGNFPMEFGVWEGVQSIDTSCGIQIDEFSARTEPPGSIFEDFHDFVVFACVLELLMLPPRGLMTVCECPKPARNASRTSSILGINIRPERVPLGSFRFHLCRFGIFCRSDPKPFRGANLAVGR